MKTTHTHDSRTGALLAVVGISIALAGAGTPSAAEVALEGAKAGEWTMDFEAARAVAKEKDIPLLLNFTGSDWCGWCKLMDREVYSKKAWQEYAADKMMLVTLDFPNDKSIVPEKYVGRNVSLRRQYSVEGYPTYVILDADGSTELGRLGAGRDKTPESFIKEFEGVVRFRPSNIEAKVKELGEEKGQAYRDALAAVKTAEKELEEWLETRPVRNDENLKKFEGYQESIRKAREAIENF